jgi:hypothetical protein
MIDARPVVVQMLFMKANPSPKAAGLKMELVSPLNVLFDELRSGTGLQSIPAERQAGGAL